VVVVLIMVHLVVVVLVDQVVVDLVGWVLVVVDMGQELLEQRTLEVVEVEVEPLALVDLALSSFDTSLDK
tara:strand:+ start:752 stop:961 length:210 start_codon:yes stop_codon:yes gene_type:complete